MFRDGTAAAAHLYQAAWRASWPLVLAGVHRGGTGTSCDPSRRTERLGRATVERPEGPLLWLHAAGRGETVAARALTLGLREIGWSGSILVTTFSGSGASVIAGAEGVVHQFAPLDDRRFVARFLDHWAPDAGVVLVADIWPNLLAEADRRGIPLGMCSTSISERSLARWRSWPARPLARDLFKRFNFVLTTDAEQQQHMQQLGATVAEPLGCLKVAAESLPVDATLVEAIRAGAADRPVVVAASVHAEEEDLILDALATLPALGVVAPRYPGRRGDAIEARLARRGLRAGRRSRGEMPAAGHSLWIADSFGELGSLYSASDVVVLGGSFGTRGGHNPAEPARFGCAILTGPDTSANAETTVELLEAGALVRLEGGESVGAAVGKVLDDVDFRQRLGTRAAERSAAWVERRRTAARRVIALLGS